MEERKLYRKIRIFTWIFTGIAVVISLLLFPGQFQTIGIGIILGALSGVLSFQMIIRSCDKIDGDMPYVKQFAYNSYLKRYLLYFVIFGASAYKGVEVLSLLVGILLHKVAIVLCSIA